MRIINSTYEKKIYFPNFMSIAIKMTKLFIIYAEN